MAHKQNRQGDLPMLHPSTKKLIDRLAEMTELGKLDWVEGENDTLIYSTEGYSVCLAAGASEVVINSIDGKELERASAEELAATTTDEGGSYTDIVAEMTKEAVRIARGTEAAISSLLAGMDDAPAAVEPEPETLDADAPEDVADETEALASDEVDALAPEQPAEPAPEIEAAPSDAETMEAETFGEEAESVQTHWLTDDSAVAETGQTSDSAAAESDLSSDNPSDAVIEADEPPAAAADDPDAQDAASDELESETGVTEAVARLADEVNGRDQSDIGAAAAAAVGTVALAAGMADNDEEESVADTATEPVIDDEPLAEAAAAPATAHTYVPFGLDEDSDEEPVAAAPETVESVEEAPASIEAPAEPVEVTPVATFTTATMDAPTPEASDEVEEVKPEAPAEPEAPAFVSVEPEAFSAEPVAEANAAPEPAPEIDEAPEIAAETPSEPEEVPAEPAAAPAQVYSLSGIGAGFGLGALAAKTEASGIPSGMSPTEPEPEKIIIDATDDVLPEPEGMDGFRPDHPAAAGISFGQTETPDAGNEDDAEAESDGDLLKPRTRFNPWD